MNVVHAHAVGPYSLWRLRAGGKKVVSVHAMPDNAKRERDPMGVRKTVEVLGDGVDASRYFNSGSLKKVVRERLVRLPEHIFASRD